MNSISEMKSALARTKEDVDFASWSLDREDADVDEIVAHAIYRLREGVRLLKRAKFEHEHEDRP